MREEDNAPSDHPESENEPGGARKKGKKPGPVRKFSANLPFSIDSPYDAFLAERIPLANAFTMALAECVRRRTTATRTFHAAECGVYTGQSLIACHHLARRIGVDMRFVGLDTFAGLPELSETDLELAPEDAPYRSRTLFDDTSLETVETTLREAGCQHVTLVKGLFEETLPTLPERKYAFVNIDCDLYDGHMQCLEYFYDRTLNGGIIYFDDYHSFHYPMARSAIDDFMRDKPEQLFHVRYGAEGRNHTKTYFVKF